MLRMLFLNEPFQKNNISPCMWMVTKESDGKHFSACDWDLKMYSHSINKAEEFLNRYDRYNDPNWKDPSDEDD